jgi:hypothetical protein
MAKMESSSSILIKKKMLTIRSEKLAYWYFRLNGFLTIENFIVHPNSGSQQETEIDIIAARFPYRTELPENEHPMQDDECLILKPNKIRIVLAEVKARRCRINPAWTNPNKENMPQIISALGPFEGETVMLVSDEIYKHGYYEDENFVVSLCCVGQEENLKIHVQFPDVPQLTWNHVLSFIYDRFSKYEIYKRQHQQRDSTGQMLFEHFQKCDRNEFLETIKIA